jgi:hypothetical protein
VDRILKKFSWKKKRKPYDWLSEHKKKKKPHRFYQRIPFGLILVWLALGGIALSAILSSNLAETPWDKALKSTATNAERISCYNPYIIDGDTLDCGGHRIRLASIDAPEISDCRPGRKCVSGDPYAAKKYLQSMARGAVKCIKSDTDHYGRTIALCEANGVDFSCAMVEAIKGEFKKDWSNVLGQRANLLRIRAPEYKNRFLDDNLPLDLKGGFNPSKSIRRNYCVL